MHVCVKRGDTWSMAGRVFSSFARVGWHAQWGRSCVPAHIWGFLDHCGSRWSPSALCMHTWEQTITLNVSIIYGNHLWHWKQLYTSLISVKHTLFSWIITTPTFSMHWCAIESLQYYDAMAFHISILAAHRKWLMAQSFFCHLVHCYITVFCNLHALYALDANIQVRGICFSSTLEWAI